MGRGIKIKTPDATHLATAIIYEAEEFHTLDGGGERQRPSDLLRLNGDVAGYPLHIRMPVSAPPPLFRMTSPESSKPALSRGSLAEQNGKIAEPETAEIRGSGDGHPESQRARED